MMQKKCFKELSKDKNSFEELFSIEDEDYENY